MVTVTQWANGFGLSAATSPVPPPALSLPVTVANTPGDWLFAICAWRPAAQNSGVTVSVDDDAKNWWEPLGAPAADSSAQGTTRCSVWAAPAARLTDPFRGYTTVMCAPTGPVAALVMIVLDVTGLAPWLELAFAPVTAYANAGTSLSLPAATSPPASCFAITCAATDLSTATVGFTGTGFTALTGEAVTNGTDHTADLELNAQWGTFAAGSSPAPGWTSSPASDMSGILAAVAVTAAAPVAPNPNWPIVITELAPGAGVTTPPSELNWQGASHRDLAFSFTGGQPYLLGGLQAGNGALTLDNPDLNLTPPGAGPWAGIDSGCPARVRAILPASATPHYVACNAFLQQLPTSYDDQVRGSIQATLTDSFGYATSSIPPVLEAEILTDSPYAYWPLTDPAGSTAASNAATANPRPLILGGAKFGTSGATAAFGANSGALKGDSGDGMFGQSGVPSSGLAGFSLNCADSGYPTLTAGVTVEGWFQATATTPSTYDVLTLQNSIANVVECQVQSANLVIKGFKNASTHTDITLSTINFGATATPLWHLAMAITRTGYTFYVNGAAAASGTWASGNLPPVFTDVWVNGNWSPFGSFFGKLYNGYAAHIAVTPGLLPAARIAAHYQAGAAAFAGEPAHYRIERILGYAGLPGRRVIIPEAPGMPGAYPVTATSPPQDTTPMSSMATLGGSAPALSAPGVPGFSPGSGTQANGALVASALSTVPAVLTMAPTGGLFYLPRGYAANQPIMWVLGDSTAAGEVPVQGDVVFGYDPGYVRNDVQLTQPDTGTQTSPSLASVAEASQDQYGDQSYQATGYLLDDVTSPLSQAPNMLDLANWVAGANATPRLRAVATVIASATSPTVVPGGWPFVLGVAPGDMVQVNSRPPTSPGAVISVFTRVAQVQRTLTYSPDGAEGSAQVTLDAAPEQITLAAGDMNRGVLNGQNVLGW
jgi:hypothetical protein